MTEKEFNDYLYNKSLEIEVLSDHGSNPQSTVLEASIITSSMQLKAKMHIILWIHVCGIKMILSKILRNSINFAIFFFFLHKKSTFNQEI
jgi:hypothetical protein